MTKQEPIDQKLLALAEESGDVCFLADCRDERRTFLEVIANNPLHTERIANDIFTPEEAQYLLKKRRDLQDAAKEQLEKPAGYRDGELLTIRYQMDLALFGSLALYQTAKSRTGVTDIVVETLQKASEEHSLLESVCYLLGTNIYSLPVVDNLLTIFLNLNDNPQATEHVAKALIAVQEKMSCEPYMILATRTLREMQTEEHARALSEAMRYAVTYCTNARKILKGLGRPYLIKHLRQEPALSRERNRDILIALATVATLPHATNAVEKTVGFFVKYDMLTERMKKRVATEIRTVAQETRSTQTIEDVTDILLRDDIHFERVVDLFTTRVDRFIGEDVAVSIVQKAIETKNPERTKGFVNAMAEPCVLAYLYDDGSHRSKMVSDYQTMVCIAYNTESSFAVTAAQKTLQNYASCCEGRYQNVYTRVGNMMLWVSGISPDVTTREDTVVRVATQLDSFLERALLLPAEKRFILLTEENIRSIGRRVLAGDASAAENVAQHT